MIGNIILEASLIPDMSEICTLVKLIASKHGMAMSGDAEVCRAMSGDAEGCRVILGDVVLLFPISNFCSSMRFLQT